ncbi:fumarylacetoacetate hydrolase family protein [Neptunicella sp. SCSIO 80796]|uniref:fumarylacetoacetate hydrolase family protein n=1 Tax=Neptunicella plasticusilytica TaxID=3117012 RepID=UPI003A4D40B4
MKLYKTASANLLELDGQYYTLPQKNWDTLINNDNLYQDLLSLSQSLHPMTNADTLINTQLQAPVQSQELWASGVTYLRSKQGRQEEANEAGGGDFYERVYEAERPELFFKATANRISASGEPIRVRADSTWDVPEPELVLVISASGKIIGYSIGNDVSSRSIEGENPLYLPQAKTYDGCAALGPCILVLENELAMETQIHLSIEREQHPIFQESIAISQIKRQFTQLVEFLYRECSFPHGALLMTGTGIVPPGEFSLLPGDDVRISIDGIGTLLNPVAA